MKPLSYAYVVKSFVGYLQGTEKAHHTVSSYRSDLTSFRHYLEHRFGAKAVVLEKVGQKDLEEYNDYLKSKGLRVNTRRRKVLTVRRLFRYLNKRGKLDVDPALKMPAPGKLEKVPHTLSIPDLLKKLHADINIETRHSLILQVMAETGCLVSEVAKLRVDSISEAPAIEFLSKAPRVVPISPMLHIHLKAYAQAKAAEGKGPWLFNGHTRHGALSGPISPRGVELVLKDMARKLGVKKMTPRMIRHSAVCFWHQSGLSVDEMQRRLGLKTQYAFRTYEVLFKSNY